MANNVEISPAARFLLIAASFVIVVAGMKAAGTLIVPFLLALFIAILLSPGLYWLRSKGVNSTLAVLIMISLLFLIMFKLTGFVGSSIQDFTRKAPEYQTRLATEVHKFAEWADAKGWNVNEVLLEDVFNPAVALGMAANTLTGLVNMLSNTFLVMLTVVFIMFEVSGFPSKVTAAFKNPDSSMEHFHKIAESVNRYLFMKTLISMATGLIVFAFLKFFDVDFAASWALFAFLLNYVPNIGSILAAIPAVLMALLNHGISTAVWVAGCYIITNVAIGNFIEPKFMGKGLGLSTLVVFVSLIFWGWVLGPVGMLLSVPLTMILKIVLETGEDTRWIAVMLGSNPDQARIE